VISERGILIGSGIPWHVCLVLGDVGWGRVVGGVGEVCLCSCIGLAAMKSLRCYEYKHVVWFIETLLYFM
jgi:hypothetical protein